MSIEPRVELDSIELDRPDTHFEHVADFSAYHGDRPGQLRDASARCALREKKSASL